MDGKKMVWWGMMIGSTVGGALPYLWGGGIVSYLVWGAIGGIGGIWLAFKLAKATGAF